MKLLCAHRHSRRGFLLRRSQIGSIKFDRHKLMILLILTTFSFAHTRGILRGSVSDAQTGEELTGVNIQLAGTVLGASTRLDGSFEIAGIEPGNYTVVATCLGYQRHEVRVTVAAGETLTLDLEITPHPVDIGTVLVESERVYSAASSRAVRQFDIRTRPARSAQDMLQLAPGVFIAQHAGGGKAEQIFIRGFDADHGTDVNISVDDVPTNMVSHGHGQGYADLHYLISDVVENIEVFKGPYFAQFGNLATAGAIRFETREHIGANQIRLEGGEFGTTRLTTLLQIPSGGEHQNAYIAGQFYRTDGPVESEQNFERFNLFGKFHTHLSSNSKLLLSAGAFSSGWDASGQIPRRAVAQGRISRFGAIDDLEGGTTSRQDFNLKYLIHGEQNSELDLQIYATRYNFKLFSNFTFFRDQPDAGDMIEQTDDRQIFGLNSRYRFTSRMGSVVTVTTLGGGFRADEIALSLWRSPDRVRQTRLVDADIHERNLFLWAQQEWLFSPRFRVQAGLRGDYFTYNVEDRLDGVDNGLPHASGYARLSILSPKLNAVFSPATALDVFANIGSGFHSNDARSAVISQRIAEIYRAERRRGATDGEIEALLQNRNFDPQQRKVETLPRAVGAELGFRARAAAGINFSAALWWLDLEREYVYVGDAGTTELSDPTTRIGVDLEARVQLRPWLWGDADINIARGRIDGAPDGAGHIPLAPRFTSTGGLTALHPGGFEGSFRYRHITDRPANEDNSVVAKGYTVLDLSLGYRIPGTGLKLLGAVENLLDTEWNEAQFDTESRLPGEPEPVSEIHFTPGNPRNLRLGLSYQF